MNLNVKGIILKLTKKKHRRKFQIDNIKIKTFNLQIHHMEWKDRPPTRRYLQCIYSVKDQCYQFPSLKRQTNRKMVERYDQVFHKRQTDGSETYEKIFNLINNQRNPN